MVGGTESRNMDLRVNAEVGHRFGGKIICWNMNGSRGMMEHRSMDFGTLDLRVKHKV